MLPNAKIRHRDGNFTSHAKNFKYFYKTCIEYIHKDDFPSALSYRRFVELMPRLFVPFNIFLHMLFDKETGAYFIDATAIKVCHNIAKPL